MENVLSSIQGILPVITVIMAIVIVILLILVIVLWSGLGKLEKKFTKLTKGVDNKNLEELIVNELDKIEASKEIANQSLDLAKKLQRDIDECVQKVAIMRYKAFDDVGSDLSYSIAILDGHNDGIVLTGLYGRHDSTTYAKPIDKGISRYELSDEENHVLKEAVSKVI